MNDQQNRSTNLILRIMLLPINLLMSAQPITVLLIAALLTLLGFGIYYSFNSDFFGLAAPQFSKLAFSSGYETVHDPEGRRWGIHYESNKDVTFSGVIRHVSHWRDEDIPFATHDVLVTTGEFTSQDRVHVSVLFHTFTYRYEKAPRPSGTINLLHIVPATPEIYRELLQVREWNQVSISGREILRIERFDPQGNFLGAWQDAGCNSILVNSVVLHARGTPIP